MLTTAAYANRKWGAFPVLREALEGKPRPSDWQRTSVDDTTADRMIRLFDIAGVAVEFRVDVWNVTRIEPARNEGHQELARLAADLRGIAEIFKNLARHVDDLHYVVEKPEKPAGHG